MTLYTKMNKTEKQLFNTEASQEEQPDAAIITFFMMPLRSSMDRKVSIRSFCRLFHTQGAK